MYEWLYKCLDVLDEEDVNRANALLAAAGCAATVSVARHQTDAVLREKFQEGAPAAILDDDDPYSVPSRNWWKTTTTEAA